jgi:hypothetical protein
MIFCRSSFIGPVNHLRFLHIELANYSDFDTNTVAPKVLHVVGIDVGATALVQPYEGVNVFDFVNRPFELREALGVGGGYLELFRLLGDSDAHLIEFGIEFIRLLKSSGRTSSRQAALPRSPHWCSLA